MHVIVPLPGPARVRESGLHLWNSRPAWKEDNAAQDDCKPQSVTPRRADQKRSPPAPLRVIRRFNCAATPFLFYTRHESGYAGQPEKEESHAARRPSHAWFVTCNVIVGARPNVRLRPAGNATFRANPHHFRRDCRRRCFSNSSSRSFSGAVVHASGFLPREGRSFASHRI